MCMRRYTLKELEGMVRDAERLVPGTAEATAAALHRKHHPAPKPQPQRLGPLVQQEMLPMSPPTPPPPPAWVLAEWEASAKRKRAARDGAPQL